MRHREVKETTWQRIWRAVALFAYRHWARPTTEKPLGMPFNRDPEYPCTAYEPRPFQLRDWRDCQGDSHYLCKECCHLVPRHDDDCACAGDETEHDASCANCDCGLRERMADQ